MLKIYLQCIFFLGLLSYFGRFQGFKIKRHLYLLIKIRQEKNAFNEFKHEP